MNKKLSIAFVWHMHQPMYKLNADSDYLMPWVRLHAVKDYLDIPDGFCYQKSPKSLLSYGYFKTDVSTSNPLAVLSETDNILTFFNIYEEYRKQGFPDIEIYTKIKKNKDNYISPSINFNYRNEDNYIKSLNELGISYEIPKILIDFYNNSLDIENNLDEIINSYNQYKKDILIKKKA